MHAKENLIRSHLSARGMSVDKNYDVDMSRPG